MLMITHLAYIGAENKFLLPKKQHWFFDVCWVINFIKLSTCRVRCFVSLCTYRVKFSIRVDKKCCESRHFQLNNLLKTNKIYLFICNDVYKYCTWLPSLKEYDKFRGILGYTHKWQCGDKQLYIMIYIMSYWFM